MRGVRAMLLFSCIVAALSPAFAGFQSTETYLVAVGRAPGQLGAQIYSTVWATNLSGVTNSFTVYFLRQGQANTSPASFSDTLAPGETKIYENIVESKFGLTGVIGATRIVSSGEILVSERIYNQPSGADLGNTEGFFFAGVPKTFSISSGQSASIQGVNQGGSENFRSNFILVETGGAGTTVNVQVFDSNGTQLGQKAYPLQAYEQFQANVGDIVPSIATTNGRITATVTGGTGSVLLAGAQVANESQDASGFEMSFRDDILGSGGGTAGVTSLNGLAGALTIAHGANTTVNVNGNTITIDAVSGSGTGLTAVAHDNSLTGSGTVPLPLGIANGQVVRSLTVGGSTLHDAITLAAGSNVTLTPSGNTLTIAASGSGGGGVSSLNTLTGALSITSGNAISVTQSGSSIQVAYTGGGSSGITSVTHDATLAGAGTGASPLGIAPGGVGTTQLNAAGSSSGQVLKSNGPAVSWQNDGLTLPYSGTTNSAGPAVSLVSTGGTALSGTGSGSGISGSSDVFGIIGEATGSLSSAAGVYGAHSQSGNYGELATPNEGVFGNAPHGVGVTGWGGNSQRVGMLGTPDVGVQGSDSGTGAFGFLAGAIVSGSFGVYGNAPSGYGVLGVGGKYGVLGEGTNSNNGVVGLSGGGNSAGVEGQFTSAGNFGALGGSSYGVFSHGAFLGDGAKYFVEPHPTDASKQILYVCLEGPESGTYFRGTGRIMNGFATIEVPDHFRMVTAEKGLTVVVTPVGEFAALVCVKKGLDKIVIKGSGDVEFDYVVNGVRKAFEDHQPIVENAIFVPRSKDDARFGTGLPAESVRRLKANGTLNEDGSINLETAHRLGWDQRPGWNEAPANQGVEK